MFLPPFRSHLNNEIKKHASSNYTFSGTQRGKPTFEAALRYSSLYMLKLKILCGFISTNPSLCFYISVIPTSERSPAAGKTAARGFTWIMVIDIHAHRFSFVCKQEKRGISHVAIPL